MADEAILAVDDAGVFAFFDAVFAGDARVVPRTFGHDAVDLHLHGLLEAGDGDVMTVEQREKAWLAGRPVVGGLVAGGADVVGGETQEGFGDVAHDVAFMVAFAKKRTEK